MDLHNQGAGVNVGRGVAVWVMVGFLNPQGVREGVNVAGITAVGVVNTSGG